MVLPWTPGFETLARTQLESVHMTYNCQEREQMCGTSAIHPISKEAMRLDNIDDLLRTVPIELVHIVVKQLVNSQWRYWRLPRLLCGPFILVQ